MPLSLPTEQQAAPGVGVKILATPLGANVRWLHTPDLEQKLQIFEYPNHLLIVPNVAGEFFVGADTPEDPPVWCKIVVASPRSAWRLPSIPALPWGSIGYWAAILLFAVAVFFAGRHLPGPSPVDPPAPTPPGPVDPPKPPPAPKPPAPIAAPGFRVLVVYESTDPKTPKLTRKQINELYSSDLADYLAAKCIKVDGQPEWRVWDKDVSLANVSEIWRQAMGRPRASTPWVIISDGTTGFEGPLPDGGILDLIKKYGGS